MLNNSQNKKYIIVFLFVLSFMLYAKTINYGFVWDDERIHLTNNEQLMKEEFTAFWLKPYAGMYIPVSYTTWAFAKKIAVHKKVLSPKIFHTLNVTTHAVNGVLVFLLLLLLFKNQTNALIGSLVFILHPLQVDSVAWISEFRGLYSACFSLMALLILFKHLEKTSNVTFKKMVFSKHFVFATLFFILALLSKPSAVVLPLLMLVLVWCFYKNKFNTVALSMLVWVLIVLPIVLITRSAQSNETIYTGITIWQRVLIASDSLFFYVTKLFVPYPLVACYGFTPASIAGSSMAYIAMGTCIFIFTFLVVKRNTYPLLFSGFLIVLVVILPVSGIVPFEYQNHSTVADRYMYLGVLGLSVTVPAVIEYLKNVQWLKYAAGVLLVVLLFLTITQTNNWKNEFAVWDHTINHYQNSANVFYNRGVEYSKQQNFSAAINDYTQSLLLQPTYLDALFNRANAYENIGNANAALNDYNAYLAIDTKDGSVYYKRAYLMYKMGNLPQALEDAIKAEQLGFAMAVKFKNFFQDKTNASAEKQ